MLIWIPRNVLWAIVVTVTRAIYNVLGVDRNDYKDLLGIYISKSEGANFGLSVLTDLQSRGVKDILTGCTDNLTGFRLIEYVKTIPK